MLWVCLLCVARCVVLCCPPLLLTIVCSVLLVFAIGCGLDVGCNLLAAVCCVVLLVVVFVWLLVCVVCAWVLLCMCCLWFDCCVLFVV